jgi:hypothetical protein
MFTGIKAFESVTLTAVTQICEEWIENVSIRMVIEIVDFRNSVQGWSGVNIDTFSVSIINFYVFDEYQMLHKCIKIQIDWIDRVCNTPRALARPLPLSPKSHRPDPQDSIFAFSSSSSPYPLKLRGDLVSSQCHIAYWSSPEILRLGISIDRRCDRHFPGPQTFYKWTEEVCSLYFGSNHEIGGFYGENWSRIDWGASKSLKI